MDETLSYSCTTLLTSILWICICVTFIIYDYDSFKFPLSPITLMIYLINNFINFFCPHPCRFKGSLRGWEKQHNKSFRTNIFIASFIPPWPTALRILYLLTLSNYFVHDMNNAFSLVYLLTYLISHDCIINCTCNIMVINVLSCLVMIRNNYFFRVTLGDKGDNELNLIETIWAVMFVCCICCR